MIFDDWTGWRGCCRHCNRGISVCGDLDERGFCTFCIDHGRDGLYRDSPPKREQQGAGDE